MSHGCLLTDGTRDDRLGLAVGRREGQLRLACTALVGGHTEAEDDGVGLAADVLAVEIADPAAVGLGDAEISTGTLVANLHFDIAAGFADGIRGRLDLDQRLLDLDNGDVDKLVDALILARTTLDGHLVADVETPALDGIVLQLAVLVGRTVDDDFASGILQVEVAILLIVAIPARDDTLHAIGRTGRTSQYLGNGSLGGVERALTDDDELLLATGRDLQLCFAAALSSIGMEGDAALAVGA